MRASRSDLPGTDQASRPAEAGALIHRGAELVHLGEQLRVRMFALALLLLGATGVFSVPLAQANPLEHARPLTILFSALAIFASAYGLVRRREVYLWLGRNPVRQLILGLIAGTIVLADGPYSPCWWIASALLLSVAVVGSTATILCAAIFTAAAYAGGTLLRGSSLMPGGDSEYLAVTASLLVNPLIAYAIVESFVRFVLHLHRLEGKVIAAAQPADPAPALVAAPHLGEAPVPHVVSSVHEEALSAQGKARGARPALPRRRDASRLTTRQLEVALLARDGLRQAEIAEALGISQRQVERHLEEARRRVGAATTAQLMAVLVSEYLAPAMSATDLDTEEVPSPEADEQPVPSTG